MELLTHWRRIAFTRAFALWTMLIAAWIYRGVQSFEIRGSMDAAAVGVAIGILLFVWMVPLTLSSLTYALFRR
jgi:hypothetical protein